MTQNKPIQSLQQEMEAIRTQIEMLQQERQRISIERVDPEDDSPEAIANAYRRQAREMVHQSAELKGIDDAIVALEAKLQVKQKQSQPAEYCSPMQQQVEEARIQARFHAERINQLGAELASEVKNLKAIADDISPMYWQVYYKPFITGFRTISVPHVRSDGDVWTIVNRIV